MGIIRINKKDSGYTQMSNVHLNDKNLSLKSKGLLSFMLTKPNDWNFSVMGLVSQLKESKTSIMSSINELIDLKYTKRSQSKLQGRFSSCDYDVYEVPYAQTPQAQNPHTDIQHAESDTLVITNTSNNSNKVITNKEKKGNDLEIIDPSQTSLITQIEEIKKVALKKEKFNFRKEMVLLGFNEDLVVDWMQVRKDKKASNTKTALKGFCTQVTKTGLPINEVLKICVEKSWKGLQSDWIKKEDNNLSASEKLAKALTNVN